MDPTDLNELLVKVVLLNHVFVERIFEWTSN